MVNCICNGTGVHILGCGCWRWCGVCNKERWELAISDNSLSCWGGGWYICNTELGAHFS